jgi:hypothetical protein
MMIPADMINGSSLWLTKGLEKVRALQRPNFSADSKIIK